MNKKNFNYKILSSKELDYLKEIYVDKKIKSMSFNDLKNFASENISLQIKSTIGNEEELEAWQEMENFFEDEFENLIKDVQKKFQLTKDSKDVAISESVNNKELAKKLNINEGEHQKTDMWED